MVSLSRVVAIVSPESAPIKRVIQEAKEKGTLIDATHGRKTKAVIITDTEYIILTYLGAETVSSRVAFEKDAKTEDEE